MTNKLTTARVSRVATPEQAAQSKCLVTDALERLSRLLDFGGSENIAAVYGPTFDNVKYTNDVFAVAGAFVKLHRVESKNQGNLVVSGSHLAAHLAADDDIVLRLDNGNDLRCHAGDVYQYGSAITVERDGKELAHWASTEWEEDPELVIGAIFKAAITIPESKES